MSIAPGQCRAARALLGWSQRDLEMRAKVSRKAIADFEREVSTPYARTIRDIVETLEAAGIEFQAPQEGIAGPGVRLKWGVEIPQRSQMGGGSDSHDDPALEAQASKADDEKSIPQEIKELRRAQPGQRMPLQASSRFTLLQEMRLAGL